MIKGNKSFMRQWILNPELRKKIDSYKRDDTILVCDIMTLQAYKSRKQNSLFHQLLDEFWKDGSSSFDDPDELRKHYKKMADLITVETTTAGGFTVIKETVNTWSKVPKEKASIAIDCLINDMFRAGVNSKRFEDIMRGIGMWFDGYEQYA